MALIPSNLRKYLHCISSCLGIAAESLFVPQSFPPFLHGLPGCLSQDLGRIVQLLVVFWFLFVVFFFNIEFPVVDYAAGRFPEVSYTLVLGCDTKNET